MEDWVRVAYFALGGWVMCFAMATLLGKMMEESWRAILLVATGVWLLFGIVTLFLIGGEYLWKIG